MKIAAILSSVIILTCVLAVKYAVNWQSPTSPEYPEGPVVDGDDLFINPLTGVFYTGDNIDENNRFSGVIVKYHDNGNLFSKAGVKNGLMHGPFDCWYRDGQKQASMVWVGNSKFIKFKAYPQAAKEYGETRQTLQAESFQAKS